MEKSVRRWPKWPRRGRKRPWTHEKHGDPANSLPWHVNSHLCGIGTTGCTADGALCRASLGDDHFHNEISRLAGISSELADIRQVAYALIDRAERYGFHCEGDVTPFCLLSVYDSTLFRLNSTYEWIIHIVSATDLPAEERMDAVFSLLPTTVRKIIFGLESEDI